MVENSASSSAMTDLEPRDTDSVVGDLNEVAMLDDLQVTEEIDLGPDDVPPPYADAPGAARFAIEPFASPTSTTFSRASMTVFDLEWSSTLTCVSVASHTSPMSPL